MSGQGAPSGVAEHQDGPPRPPPGTWLRHRSGVEGPFAGEIRIGCGRVQWCVRAQWPDVMVTHYAAPPETWHVVPMCPTCGAPLGVRADDDGMGATARGGCTSYHWCSQCGEPGGA